MARFYKYIIHHTSYLFLLVSSLFFLSSCQEGSEAGDLIGQWRLSDSDTHYVSFSGSVALFRGINEGEVYGNFQHAGDSLFIQCYSIYEVRSDTLMVEDSFGFKPFKNIRVKIESLSSDRLLLSKDQQHWTFHKY